MHNKRNESNTSYSLFQSCPRAYEHRYENRLVPLEKDPIRFYGIQFHEAMEHLYKKRDLELVHQHIDKMCADREQDEKTKRHWHLLRAMTTGYDAHYADFDDFDVMHVEKKFVVPIINPVTGSISRTTKLAFIIDLLARKDGENFIFDHKVVSNLDGNRLEGLWLNRQFALYSIGIQQALEIPVSGVIVNYAVKPKLKQKEGETEKQFEMRRAELAKRNKSGRSSAQRRIPESDEEFQARLIAKCLEPGMYHREVLYFPEDLLRQTQADIWELTLQINDARRRNVFVRNPDSCFRYGRACDYYAICASGGSENVIQNMYKRLEPRGSR